MARTARCLHPGDNIRFGAVMASDADDQVVRDLLADAVIPDKGNL